MKATVRRVDSHLMRIVIFVLFVIAALPASVLAAENSLSHDDAILKPFVGKRVVAEGLAWGAMAKGLGERLVLPSGTPLYFTGEKFRKQHKNGRTVRVTGRLKIETMEAAPPGTQGYTDGFQYYAIEIESIRVIDEVRREFPELAKK